MKKAVPRPAKSGGGKKPVRLTREQQVRATIVMIEDEVEERSDGAAAVSIFLTQPSRSLLTSLIAGPGRKEQGRLYEAAHE